MGAQSICSQSHRKDLDSKALSGFLVGYAEDCRGYELWIPETESLVTSVHVIIYEVIPEYSQEYNAELSAHLQSTAIKVADHTSRARGLPFPRRLVPSRR
jgi:hypothetical protein